MCSRPRALLYVEGFAQEAVQETGCAAVCYFPDPSLEAMATIYPVTLEELQNIPGVGAGKAKRYGQSSVY